MKPISVAVLSHWTVSYIGSQALCRESETQGLWSPIWDAPRDVFSRLARSSTSVGNHSSLGASFPESGPEAGKWGGRCRATRSASPGPWRPLRFSGSRARLADAAHGAVGACGSPRGPGPFLGFTQQWNRGKGFPPKPKTERSACFLWNRVDDDAGHCFSGDPSSPLPSSPGPVQPLSQAFQRSRPSHRSIGFVWQTGPFWLCVTTDAV